MNTGYSAPHSPRRMAARPFPLPRLFAAIILAALAAAPAHSGVVRVRADAPGPVHDGASWDTAFLSVQEGINAAGPAEDDVWVAAGVYRGAVRLLAGVAVFGGFAGTETNREQRSWVTHAAVLDGDGADVVVRPPSVTPWSPIASIDGFTITNGGVGLGTGGALLGAVGLFASHNHITRNSGDGVSLSAQDAHIRLEDNVIDHNGGSGIYVSGSAPTVHSNTICWNAGIGIDCSWGGLVAGNILAWNGDCMSLSAYPACTARNNCSWRNNTGDYGAAYPGDANANIVADPVFADATRDNYHIQPSSRCIDSGDDSSVSPGERDMGGLSRVLGAHVDIGAYEYKQEIDVIRVSAAAPGPVHDGTTWNTAFLTVQEGIAAAGENDEIWVRAGTYAEALTLKQGVLLYGGFAGFETTLGQRNASVNVATLDSGGGAIGFYPLPSPRLDLTTALDGFTIRNRGIIGTTASKFRLANCRLFSSPINLLAEPEYGAFTIEGNVCDGAALTLTGYFMEGGETQVMGNQSLGTVSVFVNMSPVTVLGNSAASIDVAGDTNGTVVGNIVGHIAYSVGTTCTVQSNDVSSGIEGNFGLIQSNMVRGGGIQSSGGVVSNNEVQSGGIQTSARLVDNNLVTGGGIRLLPGGAKLVNNTIAANNTGGAALVIESGGALAANNVIAFSAGGGISVSGVTASLLNNCVFDNGPSNYKGIPDPTGTNGNISADPLFVDRAGGDYRLLSSSPCIDAGDDSVATGGGTDLDGNPRKLGAHVDIGAYEHVPALGSALAFGENEHGQIGDGTTVDRLSPVTVNGLTNVIAVSAGEDHSLALRSDGTVWAWGRGAYGELGVNSETDSVVPVQAQNLTNVIAISAKGWHSMAL
ncbi:MAG TPA: choice-of-anchor Q domain-containing protein, partial [Armatimonadota bacterium]